MRTRFSKFTIQNVKLIKRLDPVVRLVFYEFLMRIAMAGIYVRATSGMRTYEEQEDLYWQGRTKPGRIVTWVRGGKSFHNYGVAIDLVVLWRIGPIVFQALWAPHHYKEIGRIARELSIKQPWASDMGHFHYADGLSVDDMKAGKTPSWPQFETKENDITRRVQYRLHGHGILPL